MKNVTFRTKIEKKSEQIDPFLAIPLDFFKMQVSQKEGGLRRLTHTEICVLALIKQGSNRIDFDTIRKALNLSNEEVEKAIKVLETAELVVRNEA